MAAALAPLRVVMMGVPVMTAVVRMRTSSERGVAPEGVLMTSWICLFLSRSMAVGLPSPIFWIFSTLSPAAVPDRDEDAS
jgi:hypothetical protein